jgi:hypothetical protein
MISTIIPADDGQQKQKTPYLQIARPTAIAFSSVFVNTIPA